jgi:hypothetical protein
VGKRESNYVSGLQRKDRRGVRSAISTNAPEIRALFTSVAIIAALYGVATNRFNEQVRRNRKRFPEDFMFQLNTQEAAALRSQFATSKPLPQGRGGRRYLPYAFTEHGAIMAAVILNSPREQMLDHLQANHKNARAGNSCCPRLFSRRTA